MNKIFENIIFDLDGTLIDSETDIRDCFIKASQEILGMNKNVISIKVGPPLEQMIRNHFNDISSDDEIRFINLFRSLYKDCGFMKTVFYEGIYEMLQDLKLKKIKLFIATNKPEYLSRDIMKKLRIDFFDDICSPDSIKDIQSLSKKEIIYLLIKKNKLSRNKTLMVGDSASDILSAHDNSIFSIGVGYGYQSRDEILKAKPHLYFNTVSQLNDYLTSKIN